MNPKYTPLFEPYTLNNGVEIPNRLTVAPLTIYDSGEDSEMTEAGRTFWQDRFNGFGLYIMPFTNVHPSGIGFESPNAFDERHLPTLREYAEIAHKQSAKAVVQIAHSGLRGLRLGMLENNSDEGYISLGCGIGEIKEIRSVAEIVDELMIGIEG